MTKEEEEALAKQVAEDKARKDAEGGEKLDKLLSCLDSVGERLDSISKRMDAYEAKKDRKDDDDDATKRKDALRSRKDAGEELTAEEEDELQGKPKEVVADKSKKSRKDDEDELEDHKGFKKDSKKDDDEEEEKKDRKDSKSRRDSKREDEEDEENERKDARKDSDVRAIIAAAMKEVMPAPRSDEDYALMADAQARADSVFAAMGGHAPRPLDGESLLGYRRRLAAKLQTHSAKWKGTSLFSLPDSVLNIAEQDIYNDAMEAAQHPLDLPEGQLRGVTSNDATTGRTMTKFYGRNTFIRQLARPGRRVTAIGARKGE